MRRALWDLAARLKKKARVYRRVARDPRTPRVSRLLILGALAYLLSPIDIIPDAIPVLGQLDDLIVVPLMVAVALWFVPADVVADAEREH